MENEDLSLPLVERLRACAALWVDDQAASLARLGRAVMNDGGFFSRIESNPVTTTATLERFAEFLTNPQNWTGEVPGEVARFAQIVGFKGPGVRHGATDSANMEASATGKDGQLSGAAVAWGQV
jgi:hypothetical protein